MELIEPLLKTMVFLRSDQIITTTLDAVPTATPAYYIHQKQWQKYSDFQAEYASRVDLLRIEKREVPIAAGADKDMPQILMRGPEISKTRNHPKISRTIVHARSTRSESKNTRHVILFSKLISRGQQMSLLPR